MSLVLQVPLYSFFRRSVVRDFRIQAPVLQAKIAVKKEEPSEISTSCDVLSNFFRHACIEHFLALH